MNKEVWTGTARFKMPTIYLAVLSPTITNNDHQTDGHGGSLILNFFFLLGKFMLFFYSAVILCCFSYARRLFSDYFSDFLSYLMVVQLLAQKKTETTEINFMGYVGGWSSVTLNLISQFKYKFKYFIL